MLGCLEFLVDWYSWRLDFSCVYSFVCAFGSSLFRSCEMGAGNFVALGCTDVMGRFGVR